MPWDSSISEGQKSQGLALSLAAVLDVITNEEHEDYSNTGFNVGTVRFKYVGWGGHLDSADNSFYASSLDMDVQSYPLIGEIVFIQKVLGIPFYSRRININNKLQYNSFSNILSRLNPAKTPQDKNRNVAASKENVMQHSSAVPSEHFENTNYQERESLHTLKHFDGDVIIQNRYGATLRFSSSQLESALNQKTVPGTAEGRSILGPTKPKNNDPIIIMRVGERDTPNTSTTSTLGLIVEDINLDSSSFVLSSNQMINFKFASNDDVYFRSSNKLPNKFPMSRDDNKLTTLSGNQSLLNSGRLVLNAKTDNIILSAHQDFISLTNGDTILDTGKDFVIGGKQIHLLSDSAHLPAKYGAAREEEFTVALAEKVIEVFKKLFKALVTTGAYTSMGPFVSATGLKPMLEIIKVDLDDISSDLVKIEK